MSYLLLVGADGDSAVAIAREPEAAMAAPGPASTLYLLLLGADGESGPHPQQYQPGL